MISSDSIPPKLCCQCSHVLGQRHSLDAATACCGAPQNVVGVNLVTGAKILRISKCEDQRKDTASTTFGPTTCGSEGNWFNLYVYPREQYSKDNIPPVTIKGPRTGRVSSLPDLGMGDDS